MAGCAAFTRCGVGESGVARWKRDAEVDAIAVAAGVPDARAVLDGDGGLLGWDESPCCAYLAGHGMPCGEECRGRDHISLM